MRAFSLSGVVRIIVTLGIVLYYVGKLLIMKQYFNNTTLPYSSERILGGDLRPIYAEVDPFYRDYGYLYSLGRKPQSSTDFQVLVHNIKKSPLDYEYLEQVQIYCDKMFKY